MGKGGIVPMSHSPHARVCVVALGFIDLLVSSTGYDGNSGALLPENGIFELNTPKMGPPKFLTLIVRKLRHFANTALLRLHARD